MGLLVPSSVLAYLKLLLMQQLKRLGPYPDPVYVYDVATFTLVNNEPFRSHRDTAKHMPISTSTLPLKYILVRFSKATTTLQTGNCPWAPGVRKFPSSFE